MTASSQLKKQVAEEVDRLCHIARATFEQSFPTPAVTFRRSGKNAGTAFLQQHRVNFHPVLLAANAGAYFDEVIAHEVAHLLVFRLFGRVKPHGSEWQSVMRNVFHTEPSTTHNFDLTPLQLKTFAYRCQCGPIALSTRRHNNVSKGNQYRCKTCKEIIRRQP